MESQCRKCREEKNNLELYCGVECYTCWEIGIDWEEAKKLREKLTQYLDIDKFRIKAGLTLEQLKKVRKVISDNYVVGSDTEAAEVFKRGGKELIVAFRTTGQKDFWQPFYCLKEIDSEIKRLEPDPEPKPELKIYTGDCPICNETFFCELEESDTSEKEASDNLSQQVNEHIKKVHRGKKKKERERERERASWP